MQLAASRESGVSAGERGVCSNCGAHLTCTVGLATVSGQCSVCGGIDVAPLERRNAARSRRHFVVASVTEVDLMSASGYGGIVLERLARQAAEITAADQSCIFARDRDDPEMTVVAAANGRAEDSIGQRVGISTATSPGAGAHGAAVELRWGGEVQGALSVSRETVPRQYSPNELEVLGSLGTAAAAAIAHAHARPQWGGDVRAPIRGLSTTLAELDSYTADHSRFVVEIACEVADAFGFSSAGLAEVGVAALLHDIGKIRVPDSILLKPGELTEDERAVIAQHPVFGAEVLTRVSGLEVVAMLVRYHHERWDGAGYPDGLAGTRIPRASRIIAACDAYSAMTSDRPYRDAMTHERALAELWDGAGWQFDPEVVAELAAVLGHRAAA
jgi:putative nucleotidyltransferase with HDIG domain